ncbi:MAG: cobalt-precorrin-5B (C(1))-methyltransferase CbiD [Syntrophomonadaceae bacterium]|nr:cobalt-precorrin-5B (C(1))-methyltransferase CbiD [Syntrophomonadaceae bacterium]
MPQGSASRKESEGSSARVPVSSGGCAAAAAKAAALALRGVPVGREVDIALPDGRRVRVPLRSIERRGEGWRAAVTKFAGGDHDITDGAEIAALVSACAHPGVHLRGGKGVGVVTLPGLPVAVGEPAINPVPRQMITAAVKEALPDAVGVEVTIEVPAGEELAAHTFNPRLGIRGGISILGTSGLVRPMCRQALLCSLLPALDVARANGVETVYLVPGHIGRSAVLRRFRVDPLAAVEMANFAGELLSRAAGLGFSRIVLAGHPGKLAKLAAGHFCTDSRLSPPAVSTVLQVAAAEGIAWPHPSAPLTVEHVIAGLGAGQRRRVFDAVARAVRAAARERVGCVPLAVWLCDLAGREVGRCGEPCE